MNPTLQKSYRQFQDRVRKINQYEEAAGLLYWDLRTGAPKKSVAWRSEVLGMLSAESFHMLVSPEMGELLDVLGTPDALAELDETGRKMVREYRKQYDRSKKIPADEYREYVTLTTEAESVWEEAKKNADYAAFQPYLEKIIAFNRKFVEYWGYEQHPYDALLEDYEPGMTAEKLDRLFGGLRDELVSLVASVSESPHQPETSFLQKTFDLERQHKFGRFILGQMGYDFDAGRMDVSAHPFATGLNPGDVRITTAYHEDDFTFSLFSSIHEGGHALYEQNVDPDLNGTGLRDGASMGIHESQSRLWENVIGRSRPFWQRYYKDLQAAFPGCFDGVSPEDFYRAINVVRPSLIRIEADELTYNLHIMIRYELEKALFEGNLQAADLPSAWNEKYRDYLGMAPAHDAEGVLQDVHWSSGAFGYFPSYALGNMYAAQIMEALKREMPDVEQKIASGELLPLKAWLTERIYRHGKRITPDELIRRVSGKSLDPACLVNYFKEKFGDIYRL